MYRYKVEVRKSPNWRQKTAATLGVSTLSPNWQGEKFASILNFASANFKTIYIDVTDALYRHNFMAEGLAPGQALARANALGSLWLTQHQDIIDASRVKPQIIRWAEWYNHPEYRDTLAGIQRAYEVNPVFREAVVDDAMDFYRRKKITPSLIALQHGINYLIEEAAVSTIQGRGSSTLKLYPGEDLSCLSLLRRGLISEAPAGLQNEQFAKVRFEERKFNTPIITTRAITL